MTTICSHTLVRNGMPFIDLVLRQVLPFVNRMLITVSEKSNDSTLSLLERLRDEFPKKVFIDTESVGYPAELTLERQKQVEKTTEDWIWFLDDDDYWPTHEIEKIVKAIRKEEDVDGYSVNPYQVVDKNHYDNEWWNRSFSKFFKNQPGINYRGGWPRDMIFLNGTMLYWKTNPRMKRLPKARFYHLSYIKSDSFRNRDWAQAFAHKGISPAKFTKEQKKDTERIFKHL